MNDVDGPAVAESFYRDLLSGDRIDFDNVPYVLDDAVQSLRRQGLLPGRWATFIHIGA
jgi:hypothetical protein